MALGALTRAARAGMACPDWPLCHGRLIPPLDAAFYPPDPSYAVYRVYFELTHRIVAGLLAVGTVVLVTVWWRRGMRRAGVILATILSAQIAMGAVTVWLRNAPFTVVIHLALALSFLAVLLLGLRPFGIRLSSEAPPGNVAWVYRGLTAAIVVQLLLGGVVSSRSIGLSCSDFPLCNGLPIPIYWTEPIAWQMAHRAVGFAILFGIAWLCAVAWARPAPRSERLISAGLTIGIVLQIVLGGMNVWLQIPPAVSAAHLACAVLLFAAVLERVAAGTPVA
jgi:heme A synthase